MLRLLKPVPRACALHERSHRNEKPTPCKEDPAQAKINSKLIFEKPPHLFDANSIHVARERASFSKDTPARRVTQGVCAWHACAEGDVSLLCCQQLPPCRALAKLCVTLVFKEGVLNVTLASGFIQAVC